MAYSLRRSLLGWLGSKCLNAYQICKGHLAPTATGLRLEGDMLQVSRLLTDMSEIILIVLNADSLTYSFQDLAPVSQSLPIIIIFNQWPTKGLHICSPSKWKQSHLYSRTVEGRCFPSFCLAGHGLISKRSDFKFPKSSSIFF